MFKNYFKIAARQLAKQKMYSVIKIGGFALSIAACLLIALYIKGELSYDRSYPTNHRIYRITGEYNNNGKLETGADWPPPMAKALREDFPEVEKAGRLMPHPLFYCAGSNQVKTVANEENTYEVGFTYADQDMLDILQVPMVYGDRTHALSEPNTIVLTKRKADKYFPNQNPVGKLMILNNDKNRIYKVGGVIQDFPSTSHIHYDFWLTMTGYELWKGEQSGWGSSNYYTYVLLKPGADATKFQSKLKLILTKYYLPMLLQDGNKDADQFTQKAKLLAQPITDVHLYSYNIDDGLEKGDIRFVWLFGAIAGFILVIACINFINLSTAKSANRAREVGLRKVVGSHRLSLIKQFLTESLLFSVLSFVLGIFLAALFLPAFNKMFAKTLSIPWMAWWLLPVIIAAAIIIGIIAGLYPSFYLSAFKPINVLKGQLSRGSKNSILRNGLVIFQFSTSIILIIGTLVIYKQTHYILNKKIGFNKDQVLLIQGANTLENKTLSFKNELLKSADIKNVSISDYLPVSGTKRDGNTFYKEGRMKADIGVGSQKWRVDYDYISTMGMKIIEGRNFSKDMASDSSAIIINKTMAEKLGLKNPLGQRIVNGWETWTVIGVMEDFNFESMRQDVGPLCLVLGNNTSTILAVKIKTANTKSVISYVSSVWKGFAPDQPIRYTFLDESFANMYADVRRTGNIFTTFAVLAIIIACLGLFALSAFMAEQRYKEIGIRKVLGASVSGITSMLSKDFVKLVIISIVIASPIAWWAMTKWLQDFAYRISITWWMIAVAGLAAIVIALITISFQSIKAAVMNPVNVLRWE
ncbi:MAG: FtsX-like permease family protein [Bacteroidetes bacterium]|nr:MAG: FtsX-like permease family protein [Bacteroidota bacterium]